MTLIPIFLEWIKSHYDLKKENKSLGYWTIKFREISTFKEIAIKAYKRLAIILFFSIVIAQVLALWSKNNFSIVVASLFYFFVGAIYIILVMRNRKIKVEFLAKGKEKKRLLFSLYLIFGMVMVISGNKKHENLISVFFVVVLLIWVCYLFRYSERAMILDNRYANIYVRNSETAEFAEAGSIKKQGKWIIVKRYVNGFDEEIRIRENDIIRIDYYGGPIVIVEEYFRFFRKRKR